MCIRDRIGDGKPACGVSDKQIISDNPDEDPHIYLSGNTKHGPEKYWCIQYDDRGNQPSNCLLYTSRCV